MDLFPKDLVQLTKRDNSTPSESSTCHTRMITAITKLSMEMCPKNLAQVT